MRAVFKGIVALVSAVSVCFLIGSKERWVISHPVRKTTKVMAVNQEIKLVCETKSCSGFGLCHAIAFSKSRTRLVFLLLLFGLWKRVNHDLWLAENDGSLFSLWLAFGFRQSGGLYRHRPRFWNVEYIIRQSRGQRWQPSLPWRFC